MVLLLLQTEPNRPKLDLFWLISNLIIWLSMLILQCGDDGRGSSSRGNKRTDVVSKLQSFHWCKYEDWETLPLYTFSFCLSLRLKALSWQKLNDEAANVHQPEAAATSSGFQSGRTSNRWACLLLYFLKPLRLCH